MTNLQELLTASRDLSPEERLRLAETIWEEVPPQAWPLLDAATLVQVQERSAEYDAGRMSTAQWPDVRMKARRMAGLEE